MRVAIVHDWLFSMRGGEKCLEEILQFFPEADLFTIFYKPGEISAHISKHRIIASSLNSLPGVSRYYRHLLAIYPLAIGQLSRLISQGEYQVVISVSHCAVKNLKLERGVKHLCYCLTPMRYIWDQYDAYFKGNLFEPMVRPLAARLRTWDRAGTAGVNRLLCISNFVKNRISRVYDRDSFVVYPPVKTDWITPAAKGEKGRGFLCANALVPYKNVDVVVRAFNELKLPLTIVGRGPEGARLERAANSNINFISYLPNEKLAELYRNSEALVFAAEEDFGMIPVEMQAAGRPVICLGKGGSLETVIAEGPKTTGIFFREPRVDALVEAVRNFLDRQVEFSVDNCLERAAEFSLNRFRREFSVHLHELSLLQDLKISVSTEPLFERKVTNAC